jgi:cobalt-zinc-cadmium efflux system outer membrane protein
MKNSIHLDKRASAGVAMVTAIVFATVFLKSGFGQPADPNPAPGAGSAANAPASPLSLAQAKQTAFEHNWDLLAAKSGIDIAAAQLIVAKEFPNPTASVSTAKIGSYDSATTLGNSFWHRSYDTIFAVSQLIEIAGKRRDRRVSAREGIVGSKARFYDAKRTLDQGVTKAYIAALLAESNVLILRESSGYLAREAQIAQARFNAGDISDSDKKQIEINSEQFDLQAQSAQATAEQARIQVEVLMGERQPRGNWRPVDSLEDMAKTQAPPVEAQAGAARADVLAAEADLRKSLADLKLQRAIRVPDPTFSLLYEHNPSPPGPPAPDTLGIGISFPLPIWNRNGGNIKAAEATRDQFGAALGKVRGQAAADISNANVEYKEAHERMERYQGQIGPKSSQVRQSVSFAYEKGGASLVALLDAQRTDNDVRLATAQAMSDTASAIADLVAAGNTLTQKELETRKQ